jgi:hypothetical protein
MEDNGGVRMKIRYYGDAEVRKWHDRAIHLLTRLQEDQGVPVEIARVNIRYGLDGDFPDKVRSQDPETVYEQDLKRNTDLNRTIEPTPSQAFRSSGGFAIAGNIAVVDNQDVVQWASTLPGYADGYGPDAEDRTAMDFLEEIAADPSNRICTDCCHLLQGSEKFCPECGSHLA